MSLEPSKASDPRPQNLEGISPPTTGDFWKIYIHLHFLRPHYSAWSVELRLSALKNQNKGYCCLIPKKIFRGRGGGCWAGRLSQVTEHCSCSHSQVVCSLNLVYGEQIIPALDGTEYVPFKTHYWESWTEGFWGDLIEKEVRYDFHFSLNPILILSFHTTCPFKITFYY